MQLQLPTMEDGMVELILNFAYILLWNSHLLMSHVESMFGFIVH